MVNFLLMEQTLVFIKPDGVKKNIIGEIISRFENAGLRVVKLAKMQLTQEQAREHYREHCGYVFFDNLVEFTVSGDIVAMILESENAVSKAREMIGCTNPKKAEKGTIRYDFGDGVPNNAIHASDSIEAANREIGNFLEYF